ncbi:hypothetical protein MSAN_00121900 [Mycena sanguinolenta]|uniref:Uncharacterized protein n=1 Tax=Mycena sanguinolenta TaxID=230812 RepID=A0A8H7DLS7_9AGAR|nr:hypothetical protein MSAN_00121900 [Mycena sanguinolenta]
MDDHSQPEPEFAHSSTRDAESPSHASGMFSNSQQFTVMGGTFTNVTHKNYAAAPSLPSDFRMIPMGDIDLRHQIRVDERTGTAYSRPRERARVRRLYSAKVEGRKSTLTVAMYQGDGAEQNQDFTEAFNYLYYAFQQEFYSRDCTKWIRRSTGRLCTELTPSETVWLDLKSPKAPALSVIYGLNAGAETIRTFIDSLTLEQYHNICTWNLKQYRCFDISAPTTVNPGAVFRCPSNQPEDSIEIAFLPSTQVDLGNWTISGGRTRDVMPNGWTRFQSGNVFNNTPYMFCSIYRQEDRETWLSQANHIFRCLSITSSFEDYVIVDQIDFHLHVSQTTGDPPEGFLFLCPKEDFRTGSSLFCWPACPAYWSLDPSGIDRLSPEEATRLGFPSFQLTTKVEGWYWDSSVYEGLSQFHEANGFDPYSQDVARHLGYPFLRLSSECDALPWAYVDSDEEDFDADIDSYWRSAYLDDYESEYPPSSTGDDSDPDLDAESSHSEADVHDPAGESCESEPTEISDCANHNASQSTLEKDMVAEEIFVPSPTFRIVLYIQLTLILFLALSGVHHYVW